MRRAFLLTAYLVVLSLTSPVPERNARNGHSARASTAVVVVERDVGLVVLGGIALAGILLTPS
jgi:hypothetical protein